MILVDTSVWVDHLRAGDAALAARLRAGQVLAHVHVIGELALGSLRNRRGVLQALQGLPKSRVAEDDEVLRLIDQRQLYGQGIGYVDAHLLTAVLLTPGSRLWTRDRRLMDVASTMGLAMA